MPEPPTRPALRERYDRRQREVVAVAARLFAERGYQATSMVDLTAATGLAAGGLYHYIGSKERLLVRICDQLMEPLLAEARAIADAGDPADLALRRLIRTWVSHIEEHRHHMLVFQQERLVLERQPQWRSVRRQRKAFEAILDGLLERAEDEGVIELPDRGLVLLATLGMVNATAQWFRPRGRLTAEQIADGYYEMLLAAYAA
jgi:TetR/AcrR family transcriptional regulator, cholesterol catabolism regulator